jgi:hypothetical protein
MCTVVPDIYKVFTAPHCRPQYSTEPDCAATTDMLTFGCALYCNLGAEYSSPPPVYAMCTVVPDIYKVFTAPHIQTSIFNRTYLRCYWRYGDNSMRVVLQTLRQIQRTSPSLRCVNCGLGYLQSIYSSAYLGFNIQPNVSALLLEISRQFNRRYTANIEPNIAHSLQLSLCEQWSRDIQCNYSSAYAGFNIQLNVSVLLLEISRRFYARYTANLVPNIEHILQFTLCELWFRSYTMLLELCTFRVQYSSERICAAIGGISAIEWSLNSKHGAKYSAPPPIYAM